MIQPMLKALLGLIVGLALGWGGSVLPGKDSNARLIGAWRKIQPGMSLQEVEAALGPPSYESGTWEAGARFPESYRKDHELRTYIVKGLGPQLLFIAFDRDGRVSFVSSSPT